MADLVTLKSVTLERHGQRANYTLVHDPADPEMSAQIQSWREEYSKISGWRNSISPYTIDRITGIETCLAWIEGALDRLRQRGFVFILSKCWTLPLAAGMDRESGRQTFPEEPFDPDSNVKFVMATSEDCAVYTPKSESVAGTTLEVTGQWTYISRNFDTQRIRNLLSFYVEGSQFSKKSQSSCSVCRSYVYQGYCEWCSSPIPAGAKDVHKKCGRAVSHDWCTNCKRQVVARPQWDGRISLYDTRHQRFPVGLTRMVAQYLLLSRNSVSIYGMKSNIEPDPYRNIGVLGYDIDTREYQVSAVKTMLHKQRGIMYLPTNSGKTLIAAAYLYKMNRPALFLVSGIELLEQQQKRLTRMLGEEVGIIGSVASGKRLWDPRRVTVASIPTLHRALKSKSPKTAQTLLNSVDILIVDEAHHAPSTTWYETIMSCPAPFRFGLSGTALDRSDRMDIKTLACFGPVISKVSNAAMIAKGISLQPYITMIEVPKTAYVTRPDSIAGDWHSVYSDGISRNDWRNKAVALQAKRYSDAGMSVVVMVNHDAQAAEIDKFMDPAVTHKYINASHPERDSALNAFKNGKIACLITTPILDEGVDIENIDAIVLAGGGKSVIKLLQRIGRGMRTRAGSNETKVGVGTNEPKLYVTDFIDTHHPVLARHCSARLAIYRSQKSFVVHLEQIGLP